MMKLCSPLTALNQLHFIQGCEALMEIGKAAGKAKGVWNYICIGMGSFWFNKELEGSKKIRLGGILRNPLF